MAEGRGREALQYAPQAATALDSVAVAVATYGGELESSGEEDLESEPRLAAPDRPRSRFSPSARELPSKVLATLYLSGMPIDALEGVLLFRRGANPSLMVFEETAESVRALGEELLIFELPPSHEESDEVPYE